ncbi:hypothetical protein STENM223S_04081 [Streptomyces tendae]
MPSVVGLSRAPVHSSASHLRRSALSSSHDEPSVAVSEGASPWPKTVAVAHSARHRVLSSFRAADSASGRLVARDRPVVSAATAVSRWMA